MAEKFDLRRHIRFGTTVEAADYDVPTQRWNVRVRESDGSTRTRSANLVISAVGIFNPVKMPDIKGLDSFTGPRFHTASLKAPRVESFGRDTMTFCPATLLPKYSA